MENYCLLDTHKEIVVCGCGCGKKPNPDSLFLHGHNRKGLPFSEEHAKKHKKSCTDANRRPERREKSRQLMKVIPRLKGPYSEDHCRHISEGLKRSPNLRRGEPWGTPFQKGHVPYNKGKKCPEISASKKGHVVTLKQRRKNREGTLRYNREHPEESKKNQRNGALALREKYPEKGDGRFFNTKPEKEMKRCLDELGIKYEFQYAVWNIEHCFVADFYLPLYNIILEVDGKEIHSSKNRLKIDLTRTKELEDVGYRVLRFWEGEFDAQKVWREI
jgi:very-short-patch-repair endonuclease